MTYATFWKGRRVLITGHTGFKGSWLLILLQHFGAEVWGVSLEPISQPNLFHEIATSMPPGDTWHHNITNILDQEQLVTLVQHIQPEIVFHLAAQALVRQSYLDSIGTWKTNVIGSLNLLEALKQLEHICSVVMVTTDKVYVNKAWAHGYREIDRLGGHDPYSASKAALEIAITSWRSSFCGPLSHQTPYLRIASARSGNVIGGGDWSMDRLVPDVISALLAGEPIRLRNPKSIRPWQHVLDPLIGYMHLAKLLTISSQPPCEAFNFGPYSSSNRTVTDIANEILKYIPGSIVESNDPNSFHEESILTLDIAKSASLLSWKPHWTLEETIKRTVNWYTSHNKGISSLACCLSDLKHFTLIN